LFEIAKKGIENYGEFPYGELQNGKGGPYDGGLTLLTPVAF
jgi:hypothetical protein